MPDFDAIAKRASEIAGTPTKDPPTFEQIRDRGKKWWDEQRVGASYTIGGDIPVTVGNSQSRFGPHADIRVFPWDPWGRRVTARGAYIPKDNVIIVDANSADTLQKLDRTTGHEVFHSINAPWVYEPFWQAAQEARADTGLEDKALAGAALRSTKGRVGALYLSEFGPDIAGGYNLPTAPRRSIIESLADYYRRQQIKDPTLENLENLPEATRFLESRKRATPLYEMFSGR